MWIGYRRARAVFARLGKDPALRIGPERTGRALQPHEPRTLRLFIRRSCRTFLFEPWSGSKFDVIVDDISGVAQEMAAVSPWFDGVPCDSGRDGTSLVVDIIRAAPGILRAAGGFSSLSSLCPGPTFCWTRLQIISARSSESPVRNGRYRTS